VSLPDISLAYYVVTNVPTFLSRQKVVSVSQATTVDKLLALFSSFVVEEAWKISLAISWIIRMTTTVSRAFKIEKETNSLSNFIPNVQVGPPYRILRQVFAAGIFGEIPHPLLSQKILNCPSLSTAPYVTWKSQRTLAHLK